MSTPEELNPPQAQTVPEQPEEASAETAPPEPGKTRRLAPTGIESLDQQLKDLVIPESIDPVLLSLWLEKEKEFYAAREGKPIPKLKKTVSSLALKFSGFLAVTTMILVILLGLLSAEEPSQVFRRAFNAILVFGAIGFVIGRVVDGCVMESSRELLREIIQRTDLDHQQRENEPI